MKYFIIASATCNCHVWLLLWSIQNATAKIKVNYFIILILFIYTVTVYIISQLLTFLLHNVVALVTHHRVGGKVVTTTHWCWPVGRNLIIQNGQI